MIKKLINKIFTAKMITLDEMTPREEVLSFIRNIRPYSTNLELIRMGPKSDGGYLIPNDLSNIEACFSPGVANEFGFEIDCYNNGMKLFLADKSVERPIIPNIEFQFKKKFISCFSREGFITMDNWVRSSLNKDNNSDLLLQMDIEGHEYASIINMSQNLLNRFRIMVIEFHDLDKIWTKSFFSFVNIAFEKILMCHTCVHIHPNNHCGYRMKNGIKIPRVMEFTFIRNDRIKTKFPKKNFNHELDVDNDTKSPPIVLPKYWFN